MIDASYNYYRIVATRTNGYTNVAMAEIDLCGAVLDVSYNFVNASTYQVGNGSLSLDKLYNSYLTLPPFTSTLNGFSTAVWVRGAADASNAAIFDFGQADASNAISARFINGVPRLYMRQSNTTYTYDIGSTSLTNDAWYHIAWTIAPSGTWTAYLNGAPLSATGVSVYPTQVLRTTNYIGKYITDTTNAQLATFYVDDFRTFDSEIDRFQVQYLYSIRVS